MTKVVSFVNLKGGVGKTALAVNFSAYCGEYGKKTLLIDLDPQTNATFSCMQVDKWEKHSQSNGTVANLLGVRRHTSAEDAQSKVEDIVCSDVFPGVDLIPSHLDLFTIDLDLGGETARETLLRRAVGDFISDYDLVVCDCPPNLTIPTQNAIALSTHYIVPLSPDYLSGLGVGLLVTRVKRLASALEHTIDHAGIVFSRVGRQARHRMETIEAIRRSFGDLVLDEQIGERAAVSEAAENSCSIFQWKDKKASEEFANVSAEILAKIGE